MRQCNYRHRQRRASSRRVECPGETTAVGWRESFPRLASHQGQKPMQERFKLSSLTHQFGQAGKPDVRDLRRVGEMPVVQFLTPPARGLIIPA